MTTLIEFEVPRPKIKQRKQNPLREEQALKEGLHPVLARLVASRPLIDTLPVLQALSPRLSHLSNPFSMMDMEKAAARIAKAVINRECIGIETDHDCDGQTSHAVLYTALHHHFGHPLSLIRSYIGHRLIEGYGLSDSVAERILNDEPRPSVVITADNGSADEPRIARLKAAGIDVVITDHHEIPIEGCPVSAYACLNPTRSDCRYGDPFIAGCMVAWILMAAVRQKLIESEHLQANCPNLGDLLDFVAVGTVADCVSIARSLNNRIVVRYGLKLIMEGKRPCWRALQNLIPNRIRSEDLGFRIAPLLNSDGRLASAFGSVTFLLAQTDEEARHWVVSLQTQNEERKQIQRDILRQAILLAKAQVHEGRYTLCIYLPDGHPGVQGIAASRITEMFGRPTAIFAPKAGRLGLITGSVRGIEGFHVRDALQQVAKEEANLLHAFGGHKGAGGLTLKLGGFDRLSLLFEKAARYQLKQEATLGPVIWTDGPLTIDDLNLELIDSIFNLEPFGREFDSPIFELRGVLKEIRAIGNGTHARVWLEISGKRFSGVWFNARQSEDQAWPVRMNTTVLVACHIKDNHFRGNRSFDIQVIAMQNI